MREHRPGKLRLQGCEYPREGGEAHDVYAKQVVIATGCRGADYLEKLRAEHNIAHKPGSQA